MDLTVQLTCQCRPGFTYKNTVSLAVHKRSKIHTAWQLAQDSKSDKIRSKEFENEIARLENSLVQKDGVEAALLARIHQLEKESTYWRLQYQNVCPYIN